jgi:hypothetical protein
VDKMDAQKIAKAVAVHLPVKHRLSICWCYLKPVHPAKCARDLAVTMPELWGLIRDSRQMLLNNDA